MWLTPSKYYAREAAAMKFYNYVPSSNRIMCNTLAQYVAHMHPVIKTKSNPLPSTHMVMRCLKLIRRLVVLGNCVGYSNLIQNLKNIQLRCK